ncbi:unnamed protein product [Spirodela intermedia]|uniref:Uncharacterized protein n=1 Tax=Spirodela intermedia TaxID=51605 RepID=A0A7I8JQC8_SPIIN|nr:unnamed protein product [Spirodela intermedia]CAA6671773.1 unnamed protein product [Spirodela intermedia]
MVGEETLVSLLQRCRKPAHLRQVAALAVAGGLRRDGRLAPKMASTFFDLGLPEDARRWFDCVVDPATVLWNIMFKGYTQRDAHRETLALFARMRVGGAAPNRYTFTFVLKSCAKLPAARTGTAVHGVAVKTGFEGNPFVGTLLIDVYSAAAGGGDCESARKVFEGMPERNVVSWTAIVSAHLASGDVGSARRLFDRVAAGADVVLWNTMVSGYISAGDMAAARELFERMPQKDLMAWNTLLHGFAIGGDLEECAKLFQAMPKRNVFSWNGLMRGYLRHERFSEALSTFTHMLRAQEVSPNDATLAMALSACSKAGALDFGRRIHLYAQSHGFMGTNHVVNGVIDMYAKCGSLHSALEVFDKTPIRDLVTWNIVIGALAAHGRAAAALGLFEKMKAERVAPDGITFIGLVYFRSMAEDHSIAPWMEHYGCVVDLLCRAGLLAEALELVGTMPVAADCVIWSTLLGACQTRGAVELAELAVEKLAALRPDDAANYVALSNVYGAAGSWGDFARAKRQMKEWNTEKSPGRSMIEIDRWVFEFCSSDGRHPRTEEIYGVLRQLKQLTRPDDDLN